MTISLDSLFNTGEKIILDSSIRGKENGNWLRDIYRAHDLDNVDLNSLHLVKQSILAAFSDYDRDNSLTVQGVICELRDYANAVRKKKLVFEKDKDREVVREHPVVQDLNRIHTGILALAELAKTKIYSPESPSYKRILETLRGIQYSILSKKYHRRETDLHVATAGIHSANYVPTHILSGDSDITKLVREYMRGKSTPYALACYYVVSDSEVGRTV